MPFLHVTSRVEDRPYDDLLMDKAERPSFPTFLFLDADGEVVAEHRGLRTVKAFAWTAGRVRHYLALRAAEDASPVDLALTEVELGLREFDDLDEVEDAELTAEESARLRQIRVNATVEETVLLLRSAREEEERAELLAELVAIHKGGVQPTTLGAYEYWFHLAAHGARAGDAALLGAALKELEALHGDDARLKPHLDQLRAKLAELGK